MSCCCSNEYATCGQIDIRGFGFWGNHYSVSLLTHWGRVMHICVSKLTIVGSDNGLSPGRRLAIIWTNDGILLIGLLGADFSEILIEILTFSFKKMRFKLSSAKWRPFCLGLNGLIMVAVSYSLAVVAVLIVCNACICSVEALPTSQSISSPLTNLFGRMMTGTFISLYMYDNICNIYFQWSQILHYKVYLRVNYDVSFLEWRRYVNRSIFSNNSVNANYERMTSFARAWYDLEPMTP